ncbi:MAG: DUF357 domain-containing protein [Candidatus Aenigmatarchaeota archaeon]|nr:MAG: DUF357 domain-containing protein [Candidatus Aenigmarchaeota archaeon]
MKTEDTLRNEIEKWTKKIGEELENIEVYGAKGREFLANIKAYVSDSAHFLEKNDLVRSFEAIVWAWAWLEIGKQLEFMAQEFVDIKRLRK